jgi:hypothetical protein
MSDSAKVTQKYLRRVRKWHAEWVANSTLLRIHGQESIDSLQAFLDQTHSEELAHVASSSESLHLWALVHFGHKLLNENVADPADFALAARYAHAAVGFSEAFADRRRGGSVRIRKAAFYLALNGLCGWREETASLGDTLVKGLGTPMLDLLHNDRHEKGVLFPAFWFILQLYCSSRNLPLDVTKYSYPEDMRPYADVLADWRTRDQTKIQQWVLAMADYHLHEARNVPDDEIAQFDTEDQMLFPYEILFWLRLREWSGLQNPEEFDHPLMKLPTARLPNPVPLPRPETPLLDAVVAKFKLEFPGSFEN